jgi:molecular chaperone GrpE (heat shock protein)
MDLYDSLERPALRERLLRSLLDAGVTAIVPEGADFDPDRDEAVTGVVTDDSALVGRIASVERVGFRDRERLLRPAEVAVYRRSQDRS